MRAQFNSGQVYLLASTTNEEKQVSHPDVLKAGLAGRPAHMTLGHIRYVRRVLHEVLTQSTFTTGPTLTAADVNYIIDTTAAVLARGQRT